MSQNNKKGFTIIEVVLVLAIAGLIFLMVFIALPALQRSQRNTQRKNDLSRFMTAVTTYQSNNSGRAPWDSCTSRGQGIPQTEACMDQNFIKRYITGGEEPSSSAQFQDPDGEQYHFYVAADMTADRPESNYASGDTFGNNDHKIDVFHHTKCGAQENSITYSSGKHDIALLMILEGN
jgi:prepilin-type N-terminal cleavage/methylation domain-containing protein